MSEGGNGLETKNFPEAVRNVLLPYRENEVCLGLRRAHLPILSLLGHKQTQEEAVLSHSKFRRTQEAQTD